MKKELNHCVQTSRIDTMSKQVAEVKLDLDQHRAAQQKNDAERMDYREKREAHDLAISNELETIKLALFGDERLEIPGDHKMIQEMHALLVQGSTLRKFFTWLFGSIMAIIIAVLYIMKLIKNLNGH